MFFRFWHERSTGKWTAGVVKGKLGSKLYVNLSDDVDTPGFADGFEALLSEVKTLTGCTLAPKPLAASPELQVQSAVGTNDTELDVGRAALKLMLILSESEPLRTAVERVLTTDMLANIIENSPDDRITALMLLANVYAVTHVCSTLMAALTRICPGQSYGLISTL